ncbi:MAG: ankyrin repeat domain-containing protein, partial [Chlamydiales bacterium]
MAYTPKEIIDFKEKRDNLKAFIEQRKKQEQTWKQELQENRKKMLVDIQDEDPKEQEKILKEMPEEIYVPTTINFTDIDGNNLLDYAIKLGDFKTVQELVAKGATSANALAYAFRGGKPEIVKFLLEKGFDHSIFSTIRNCDESCRHLFWDDLKNRFQKDYQSMIKDEDPFYIKHHQNPRVGNSKYTLLHYAALLPFAEFKALIKDIPEDKIDWKQGVHEQDVVYGSNEYFEESGSTPIAYAILSNNIEFLDFWLNLNPNIDNICYGPLGYTPLLAALRLGKVEIAKRLMERGANIYHFDKMGCSALHLAIQSGNPEAVNFVLQNATNLRMYDNYGQNPVHYLAECKNEDIIRMVLNHPSTQPMVNQKDYFGKTPLDLAKMRHNETLIKQLGDTSTTQLFSSVNISQGNVLDKLTYFLKATNAGDPASMPPGGHCNAFGFLFLYYCDRGLRKEFFDMLKLIASWDGNLEFLNEPVSFSGSYRNVTEVFQQWVSDLIWFMQAYLPKELKTINPTQQSRMEQYETVKKEKVLFPVNQKRINNYLNRDQLTE